MFLNVLDLAIFAFHISSCACYVAYEIFHGFDSYHSINTTTHRAQSTELSSSHETNVDYTQQTVSTERTQNSSIELSTITPAPLNNSTNPKNSSPYQTSTSYPKFICPENERPFNIGPFEVPTQRDIALQIQKTLTDMFDAYQRKAMNFLQEVKEATQATIGIENKCYNGVHKHQGMYKKCVKNVSRKCEYITKNIVTSLERQRDDVSAFINGTICSVKEMKADPLQLIKVLAMEQASLEFALPGFLRLLGSCSAYCNGHIPKIYNKKPVRHMTDQDLVVKHFLTQKSYLQLLKDPK